MKAIPLLAFATILSFASASHSFAAPTMSDWSCQAKFDMLDKNKDGGLSGLEAVKAVAQLSKIDVRVSDVNTISERQYLRQCN